MTHALGPHKLAAGSAIEAVGRYRTDPARAYLVELLSHPELDTATNAAVRVLEDPGSTRSAQGRALEVAVVGLSTLNGSWAWIDAANRCRSSPRLLCRVQAAAAQAHRKTRARLVKALAYATPRDVRGKAFQERLLAGCSSDVRALVAKSLRQRALRERKG